MSQDVPKICADSLRNFLKEKHGIKLKAAHAHELVAAYFGYRSKNAMLADKAHPTSNLSKAHVVVMTPNEDIDRRRECLEGLSDELPDSYALGEAVYEPLFASKIWQSPTPPFRSYLALARYIVENNEAFQSVRWKWPEFSMHHVVRVSDVENEVIITVFQTSEKPTKQSLVDVTMEIAIPRVAGRIGLGSTPLKRTLPERGILCQRSVHDQAKKIQPRVQT